MRDTPKIVVFGGGGFVGEHLVQRLSEKGFEVVVADLHNPGVPRTRFVETDVLEEIPEHEDLKHPDYVVNLAGAPIDRRWTQERKQLIYDSRVKGTRNIVSFLTLNSFRPHVYVSASAVGLYGSKEDEINERTEAGTGFLSRVVHDWEREAFEASRVGIRVAVIRTAPVLGERGIIESLARLYRLGIKLPFKRDDWFPWIHVSDLVDMYVSALTNPYFPPVVNAVAPEHITYGRLSDALFEKVSFSKRSLTVPQSLVEIVLGGSFKDAFPNQKISSVTLDRVPFTFMFPKFEHALSASLRSRIWYSNS